MFFKPFSVNQEKYFLKPGLPLLLAFTYRVHQCSWTLFATTNSMEVSSIQSLTIIVSNQVKGKVKPTLHKKVRSELGD